MSTCIAHTSVTGLKSKNNSQNNSAAVVAQLGARCIMLINLSYLSSENFIRRFSGQLEDGVNLLLNYLPGRSRVQFRGHRLQLLLFSAECLKV